MQDKIVKILDYDYTKRGGYVVLKFESGWTTRRKFINVIFTEYNRCAITGNLLQKGGKGIYINIRRKGYSRYYISNEWVSKLMTDDVEIFEELETPLTRELKHFINMLTKKRKTLDDEVNEVKKILNKFKYEKEKIGRKLSTAHKLIELLTDTKQK